MLRFYRLSPLWGLALPAIAVVYMLYTLDSAYQYMPGQGGTWKGRVQANVSGSMTFDAAQLRSGKGSPGREFPGGLVADRRARTAGRSWRSTSSSASPTTSPIMRR